MAGRAPRQRPAASGRGLRVGIVVSRFNEAITTRLLAGALGVLRARGVAARDLTVTWVPGAFEIPQVAARLARRGGLDALVCLGCVVRGETPHFDYVAGAAARGIAEVGLQAGMAVTFGLITAETMSQARARAGGRVGNRGAEAALAALELVGVFRAIDGAARRPRPPGRARNR
jgi:6,7-dimethyl-8-ribityllumazine synthase